MRRFASDAVAQRVNGVTVCTGADEPWRGSLSDRTLIAENRCAALFVSTVSPARSLCAGCRPPARNAALGEHR
jgi:hypothetical protein